MTPSMANPTMASRLNIVSHVWGFIVGEVNTHLQSKASVASVKTHLFGVAASGGTQPVVRGGVKAHEVQKSDLGTQRYNAFKATWDHFVSQQGGIHNALSAIGASTSFAGCDVVMYLVRHWTFRLGSLDSVMPSNLMQPVADQWLRFK